MKPTEREEYTERELWLARMLAEWCRLTDENGGDCPYWRRRELGNCPFVIVCTEVTAADWLKAAAKP